MAIDRSRPTQADYDREQNGLQQVLMLAWENVLDARENYQYNSGMARQAYDYRVVTTYRQTALAYKDIVKQYSWIYGK